METIVVATDHSKPADNAVRYAAGLARFFGARLVLAHALPMPVGDPMIAINLSEIKETARQQLEETRNRLISESYDFGIEYYTGFGMATDIIQGAVERHGASLVVLGMTGEAGRIKQLIGSTALKAARVFTIPVMIVPEGAAYHRIRRICLACDMDHIDETALIYSAKAFAKQFDAEMEVVTVEKAGKEAAWHTPDNYSFVERKLATVRHRQVYLKEKDPALALEYYFKFHDTDLIMVNPKKHNFFGRLFSGSITKHLAFYSRVPLLVIH